MSITQSLSAWLKVWAARLADTSESARLDTEVLFKFASGLSDTDIVSKARDLLDFPTVANTQALIELRSQGHPIAYLTGFKEFYSLGLKVNENVLIPRPETELLVDCALDVIRLKNVKHVLDLGTGSGAIALAIAHHAPSVRLDAVDQSSDAVHLARDNARSLGIENIQFLKSDWYAELENKSFDLIVSNPPYIDPDDPHLTRGDVSFEPREALSSKAQGLADLSHIIKIGPNYLNAGGSLMLEHGYAQKEAVQALFTTNGYNDIRTLQDLSKHDRVTIGRRN